MELKAQFNQLPAKPEFPELEEETLAQWKADCTFQKTLTDSANKTPWVFYDGPPFANGLPHYGHLLTGYAKDTFPRFQTMRGRHVERVFGWDTHGLPAELEAMKQLGFTKTSEVRELGVAEFNAVAKDSVLRYTEEWETYVTRQARWVDFEGGYKTLDLTYMESVLWAFKSLHEKGLMYESYKVLPYCWQDETPLSTHELSMDDDGYKDRDDLSATAAFSLVGALAESLKLSEVQVLAWTTTPWTLPMNMALAVNPELTYVEATQNGKSYLLGAEALERYEGLENTGRSFLGKELVGLAYKPLWNVPGYESERSWNVLPGSWVEATSGTGVVHLAPAHGEVDQQLCEEFGVPLLLALDSKGQYSSLVPEFQGLNVLEANELVTAHLTKSQELFSTEVYSHSYPHCWRCGKPLLYMAVSSWFVKTTALKERMLELNEEVKWVPAHMKKVFSNWLENTRDWAVTRNRFFGSPVPVWKSDNPAYPRTDVYGSLAELQKDFCQEVTDLHRPHVDELTRPNPDDPTGESTMRRVSDVLDVWFDSASMPFAQSHYPFESKDSFEAGHPADFVVEYVGQTRGWFYVLHVLSVALFDRPAFKQVVSHGVVLGSDGKKMSKKLQNYPNVNEVFDKFGSDAMRWYLLSSPLLKGGTMSVTEEGLEATVRNVLLPLWNTYRFFGLQSESFSTREFQMNSSNALDRYLLTLTKQLADEVGSALEVFDTQVACELVSRYTEKLTNVYVRWSRPRFKAGSNEAYATLGYALQTLTKVLAPLLPLTADVLWGSVSISKSSVHEELWPTLKLDNSEKLEKEFSLVEELVTSGLSVRKKASLRLRQPLSRVTLYGFEEPLTEELAALVAQELNVKEVVYGELELAASLTLKPASLGKRLGKDAQLVFSGLRENNWNTVNDEVVVNGVALLSEEYELTWNPKSKNEPGFGEFSQGALMLDTELSEELTKEGTLQDWLREVQDARKASSLALDEVVNMELVFKDAEEFNWLKSDVNLLSTLKNVGRLKEVTLTVDEEQALPFSAKLM